MNAPPWITSTEIYQTPDLNFHHTAKHSIIMSVTEHSWNFDSFQSDTYLWTQREILHMYFCAFVPILYILFQL